MQHALPELPCFYLQRRSHGLQLWSLTLVTILFEMFPITHNIGGMQQLHAKKHFQVCSKNQPVIAFNLNKGYLVSCEVFFITTFSPPTPFLSPLKKKKSLV